MMNFTHVMNEGSRRQVLDGCEAHQVAREQTFVERCFWPTAGIHTGS